MEPLKKEMRTIKSDHHNLNSYNMEKIAVLAFDTKRWICNDGIHTLAYGHRDICN